MYKKFFNINNPFWRGMGRIFDVFVLNVLWLLCCIPIVTIGPATTAFSYAMINLVRGEEIYVSQDFFRAFRGSFKQSLIAGLLLMAVGAFLIVDIYIAYKSGTGIYTFFMVLFFIFFVLWSFVTLYTVPLIAKFDNSLKNTLIRAFTLSIKNFPQTLMMLFTVVLALWLCHLLPGLIFIAFGIVCEFHSTLFAVILKPWLPKLASEEELSDGGESEDEDGDEYLDEYEYEEEIEDENGL